MSDSREAMRAAVEALEECCARFPAFGEWRHSRIDAALSLLRAALEARAEPVPVPEGYELVMVPKVQPADEPDWEGCIWQAEVATGLKVERHTMSIIIREVRRWLAGRAASPAAATQGDAPLLAYLESQKFHPSASHVEPAYRDGYNRALQTVIERIHTNHDAAAIGAESEQATEDGRHG